MMRSRVTETQIRKNSNTCSRCCITPPFIRTGNIVPKGTSILRSVAFRPHLTMGLALSQ
jgi:hypothetical protein